MHNLEEKNIGMSVCLSKAKDLLKGFPLKGFKLFGGDYSVNGMAHYPWAMAHLCDSQHHRLRSFQMCKITALHSLAHKAMAH